MSDFHVPPSSLELNDDGTKGEVTEPLSKERVLLIVAVVLVIVVILIQAAQNCHEQQRKK